MSKIFQTANNWPEPEKVYGGGRPIWFEVGRQISGGFGVDLSKYPKGSMVNAGTPFRYNEATRTAELLVSANVFEAAPVGATEIKVAKIEKNSVFTAGQNVMEAAATVDGTGTGITILSVDYTHPQYDVLKVAALEAELKVDAILYEASASGAGAKMKVVPNAFSYYQIYVDPTSSQFWISAVVEGTLLSRRTPPVSDAVKKLFTEITFSQSR